MSFPGLWISVSLVEESFFFFLCALRFLVYSIWFGCFVSKHFDLHIWFDLLACFSISKGILNSGFLARFQYYSVLKI